MKGRTVFFETKTVIKMSFCAECIENSDLTSLDNGVPEDWDLPEVWNEEAIKNFLKFNGSLFARDQGIDLDSDLFNDNYSETRVEIEE